MEFGRRQAANEGFAEYYNAVIWNKTNESDCWLYIPGQNKDWDGDGSGNSTHWVSCADDGVPGESVDAFDFYGDTCSAVESVDNRVAVYDWIRHFWDQDTEPVGSTTTSPSARS